MRQRRFNLSRKGQSCGDRAGGWYGRGRGGGGFLNLGGGPSGFLGRATSLFDCHTIGLLFAIIRFMADPNALGHDHHSKRDILVFLGESKHIFRIVCPGISSGDLNRPVAGRVLFLSSTKSGGWSFGSAATL